VNEIEVFVACSRAAFPTFARVRVCVCRVCVPPAFYAFYAFSAIVEPVSYGNMEGLKVQVPSPASIKSLNSNGLQAGFSVVCARSTFLCAASFMARQNARQLSKVITSGLSAPIKSLNFFSEKICQTIFGCWFPGNADSSQAVRRNDACLDSEL
jgi:hypothetical protein